MSKRCRVSLPLGEGVTRRASSGASRSAENSRAAARRTSRAAATHDPRAQRTRCRRRRLRTARRAGAPRATAFDSRSNGSRAGLHSRASRAHLAARRSPSERPSRRRSRTPPPTEPARGDRPRGARSLSPPTQTPAYREDSMQRRWYRQPPSPAATGDPGVDIVRFRAARLPRPGGLDLLEDRVALGEVLLQDVPHLLFHGLVLSAREALQALYHPCRHVSDRQGCTTSAHASRVLARLRGVNDLGHDADSPDGLAPANLSLRLAPRIARHPSNDPRAGLDQPLEPAPESHRSYEREGPNVGVGKRLV